MTENLITPKWPDGKHFAFTVFDDTDGASTANVGEVYAMLADLGFLTTKSVWQTRGTVPEKLQGETCQDSEYLDWLRALRAKGFEIGWHLNTWHTSSRQETLSGLREFVETFGVMPRTMANHSRNAEGIYWGDARLTGINQHVYNILTRFRNKGYFRGHEPGDDLFWGDLCERYVTYCRNFCFADINTLRECPFMPYADPERAYVRWWFASSEGASIKSFLDLLNEANQDRLEEEGGACIAYTHFSVGFQESGALNPRFKMLMQRLARKNGWFVPTGTILDYLREKNGEQIVTPRQRGQMERRWLLYKLRVGTH